MILSDLIIKLKVYWTRAATYFQVPFALFNYGSLLLLLSRQYGFSGWFVVPALLLVAIAYLLTGYLDVKLHIFQKEQSFGNAHNAEIQKLLEERKRQ